MIIPKRSKILHKGVEPDGLSGFALRALDIMTGPQDSICEEQEAERCPDIAEGINIVPPSRAISLDPWPGTPTIRHGNLANDLSTALAPDLSDDPVDEDVAANLVIAPPIGLVDALINAMVNGPTVEPPKDPVIEPIIDPPETVVDQIDPVVETADAPINDPSAPEQHEVAVSVPRSIEVVDDLTDAQEESDDSVTQATPALLVHLDEKIAIPVITTSNQAIQASSEDRSKSSDALVENLFGRMSEFFSERENDVISVAKESIERLAGADHKLLLTETRHEMANVVRVEVPKLMTSEIRVMLRTEILGAVRSEIVTIIKSEMVSLHKQLDSILSQIRALEPRLAAVEGALDKEMVVSFPEGAITVNVPVNVPEREVKIAAPINIQPPSIVFDDGAINVHLHKDASGQTTKRIKFNRDAYENIIDAEITGS